MAEREREREREKEKERDCVAQNNDDKCINVSVLFRQQKNHATSWQTPFPNATITG